MAVAVALAIEVIVAALALAGPRPGRFGWQMYSGVPVVPTVHAVTGDREVEVDVNDWLVTSRFEIDYSDLARSSGCRLTGADFIRITFADGEETVRCS